MEFDEQRHELSAIHASCLCRETKLTMCLKLFRTRKSTPRTGFLCSQDSQSMPAMWKCKKSSTSSISSSCPAVALGVKLGALLTLSATLEDRGIAAGRGLLSKAR